MRFVADAGVSPSVVEALRTDGHDAFHVRDRQLQRALDPVILTLAREERRILLAFDLDFGELLALGALESPSVILFRLSDERAASVTARLKQVLAVAQADLEAGALIVVEDARYRVRRLPIGR